MPTCKQLFERHKLLIGQLTCFCLGKTFIGVIELPNDEKNISYLPILIMAVIFYLLAFVCKLYQEGRPILKMLLIVYLRMFLIWVVSLLSTIFSFSLSHQLDWSLVQIIILTVCEILTTATLVTMCHYQFISKTQFIAYQSLLALNILALGIKTVIYIEYDLESPHKDMVLINLTTRIALAILIMDALERSYSKSITRPPTNALVEQEMSNNPNPLIA